MGAVSPYPIHCLSGGNFYFPYCRLHEELRRSIEAQMDIVRQGEGSGIEKEVVENMRHQFHLLSQVHIISLNLVTATKRQSLKSKKIENNSKTCAMH